MSGLLGSVSIRSSLAPYLSRSAKSNMTVFLCISVKISAAACGVLVASDLISPSVWKKVTQPKTNRFKAKEHGGGKFILPYPESILQSDVHPSFGTQVVRRRYFTSCICPLQAFRYRNIMHIG